MLLSLDLLLMVVTGHEWETMLVQEDYSKKSVATNWRPPGIFSRVERFDFTDRREKLLLRSLPAGPRGFRVTEFISSGHESLTTEYRKTAVVIPTRGTLQVNIDGNDVSIRPGSHIAFGPIRRKTVVIPDADGVYRSLSIIAPSPTNGGSNRYAALGSNRWLNPQNSTIVKPAVDFVEYLFGDIHTAGNPILHSPGACASAEALVSDLYGDLISTDDIQKSVPKDRASRLVSLALDYMHEHYGNPIAVSDVAKACCVSPRTLQSAFRSSINSTPQQTLTTIRLEYARLLFQRQATQTTVSSAAYQVGFNHMGRFSYNYRVMYGEHPSDTLRRHSC